MKLKIRHPWNVDPGEAVKIQRRLAPRVVTVDQIGRVRLVAGVDVGFERRNTVTRAAVVVLTFPELVVYEQSIARRPTSFPYIPGLLSFREVPAVLDALEQLNCAPDLLLCDGQGLAHPRRFGLACHIGLIAGTASIGVAKTRLVGDYIEPGNEKGSWSPLTQEGRTIGAVLRSRSNTRPLFVSVGTGVSLETAIHFVLACTTRYRLPETTRLAHRLASG